MAVSFLCPQVVGKKIGRRHARQKKRDQAGQAEIAAEIVHHPVQVSIDVPGIDHPDVGRFSHHRRSQGRGDTGCRRSDVSGDR
jgi:hypothetical protein